jgi:RNA-directed DNA polymerase
MSAERRGPAVCTGTNNMGGKGEITKTPSSLQELRRSYTSRRRRNQPEVSGDYTSMSARGTRLNEAYRMAKENDGAPGINGVAFGAIQESGVEGFLEQIRDELVSNTYRPMRVPKKEIPKDGGKKVHVLSIPDIRDPVVQGALKLILEPIFEADFQSGSYGYRPKRTAHQVVNRVAQEDCGE